ncbi:hypothetical protein BHE74_00043608, partial [Ensete ventricosum]
PRLVTQCIPEASWPRTRRCRIGLSTPSETTLIFWPRWRARHCQGCGTSRT